MKCAMCNRPLTLPAASVPTRQGPMTFGPVCAKRAGLVKLRERKPIITECAIQRGRLTVDWVNEARAV